MSATVVERVSASSEKRDSIKGRHQVNHLSIMAKRQTSIYIIALVLLISLTLANVAGLILGSCIFFVPIGLRSFVLALILLFLTAYIYSNSEKQHEIKDRLWLIIKIWMPFIIYLGISTELSQVGMWKFAGFCMRVFFPCLVLVVLYVNDKGLFNRYFARTLLVINIILAVLVPFVPTQEELIDMSIWISRGIAVSVFFLIIDLKLNRRGYLDLLLIVFLIVIMLFIGSRGPFVALLATLMLYFGLRSSRKLIVWPVMLYGCFLFVVAYLYVAPVNEAVESFLTHGHRGQYRIDNFADDRLAMIKPTVAIVKEHPLIGCGLGSWGIGYLNTIISEKAYVKLNVKKLWTRDYYYYPHNIISEILCELGVIGMLLFIALFFPYKQLLDSHNIYNYFIIMGFLFALTSSDLVINSTPFVFNTLSLLAYKE